MKSTMLTKYASPSMTAKRDPIPWFWKTSLFESDIFSELFNDFIPVTKSTSQSYRLEQTDGQMTMAFDLPGVKPSDISVSADGQHLTISYKQRGKDVSLEYDIRSDYDTSQAQAKVEHGVLELKFPKINKPKGKKINIEIK